MNDLTEINIDDMLSAWGLANWRFGRSLLRWACRRPAQGFAQDMLAFDTLTGQSGLHQASRALCQKYIGGLQASGLENLPPEGPLLVLSNHPGLADTICLFSCIQRPDLKIIALDRPFLRALPNTAGRLFMLPEDINARASLTRTAANYLKKGGMALTFPAGHIEPDPLVQMGAIQSLESWSESIGLFARLVPQMRIVVAVVGGVISPEALNNPLTRLRRKPKDQETLAAALQVALPGYHQNVVKVAFAAPLLAADLSAADPSPAGITRQITNAARQLIQNWPTKWQTILGK